MNIAVLAAHAPQDTRACSRFTLPPRRPSIPVSRILWGRHCCILSHLNPGPPLPPLPCVCVCVHMCPASCLFFPERLCSAFPCFTSGVWTSTMQRGGLEQAQAAAASNITMQCAAMLSAESKLLLLACFCDLQRAYAFKAATDHDICCHTSVNDDRD